MERKIPRLPLAHLRELHARKADRDCDVNRQHHLAPSCGGLAPTAEDSGPGKDIVGKLTQTPELENKIDQKRS